MTVVDTRRTVPARLRGAEVYDEGFEPGDVAPMVDEVGGPPTAYAFGWHGYLTRGVFSPC